MQIPRLRKLLDAGERAGPGRATFVNGGGFEEQTPGQDAPPGGALRRRRNAHARALRRQLGRSPDPCRRPVCPTTDRRGAPPPVEIAARTVDSLNVDGSISAAEIDLVWMDVQGHEAHVLAGATCLAGVPVVTEFWPFGLRRAGALARFHELTAGRRSVDLDGSGPYSPDDIDAYTNLLLFPAHAGPA